MRLCKSRIDIYCGPGESAFAFLDGLALRERLRERERLGLALRERERDERRLVGDGERERPAGALELLPAPPLAAPAPDAHDGSM